MKKFLSIILMINMVVMSAGMFVYADDETAAATAEEQETAAVSLEGMPYYRAVTVLSALGIMQGKSETDFGENDFLTRAEMSTAAVRFLGIDTENPGNSKSRYSDVADDYWGKFYIDTASDLGLVNGNGDSTFAPEDEVTAEQAIKIMVCALGYEPKAQMRGTYPGGYITVANELGMLTGIDFSDGYDQPIPRWKLAMLIEQSLEVELMEVKTYGEDRRIEVAKDKTALSAYHRTEKKSGTVVACYESTLDSDDLYASDVMIDDTVYTTDLDMGSYIGYHVDFYYSIDKNALKNKVIAFFPQKDSTVSTEIDFDDIESVSVNESFDVTVSYEVENKRTAKQITLKKPVIMYNGKAEEFATAEETQKFLDENRNQGRLVILNNANNDFQNVLSVENYDAYVVSSVDANNMQINYNVYGVGKVDTKTLDLSDKDVNSRKVFFYGENDEKIDISALEKNDVIMVYASRDKELYKIHQSKKQLTGLLNRRDKIAGTEPTPTERPQPYWKTVTNVTMDRYDRVAPEADNVTTYVYANAAIDGRTSWLYASSGEYYDIFKTDKDYKRIFHKTDFQPRSELTYPWPSDLADGGKVFELSREETSNWTLWNPWSPYYGKISTWAGAGYGAPDSSIMLTNLFNEGAVSTGDKMRITAWVIGTDVSDVLQAKYGDDGRITASANKETNVQMWISESNASDRDWQYGEDKNYNQEAPDPQKPDEVVTATMKEGEWTKLVLEYELTTDNASISSIQINNDNASHDVANFPLKLAIAGVMVEQYVDPSKAAGRPELSVDTTDYHIYIDSTEYKTVSSFPSSLLEMGKTVTVLLDKNDKIVGYIRSLSKTGYGLLMDVGIGNSAFETSLMVKILDGDNVLTTYETTEKIKAYNGTEVTKMPAAELVTNEPADPKTDWHLWSTNNAKNFEAISRTWLTDAEKSKAASRKVVYYEVNSDGKIQTILVPSMPEDNPDCKIVMVKDFEYSESNTTPSVLYHSAWPMFLFHASVVGRTETAYRIADDVIKYAAWAQDYSESDYEGTTGRTGMWEDNFFKGKSWEQAQLYRQPGSKTIDFMVMNTKKIDIEGKNKKKPVIVDNIEETADGYILNGYHPVEMTTSNNNYSCKIKKDTRLFENLWMTKPDSSGVKLTWDNIPNYAGTLPYQCSYEALGMETPYVKPGVLKAGDVVNVNDDGGEINYIEVLRRADDALMVSYSTISRSNLDGFFEKGAGFANGEITEVNYEEGYIKVKGFYWPSATDIVSSSSALYAQAANNEGNYIAEREVVFPVYRNTTIWDEARQQYQVGTFGDYNVGDLMFIYGRIDASTCAIIFKNHNKK